MGPPGDGQPTCPQSLHPGTEHAGPPPGPGSGSPSWDSTPESQKLNWSPGQTGPIPGKWTQRSRQMPERPGRCRKNRAGHRERTLRDDKTRNSERRQKEVRDDGDAGGERAADGDRRWSQGRRAAGRRRRAAPPRSLAPGAPASGASSAEARPPLSGGQVWQASRQGSCSEPKARRPAAKGWLWSHLPFSGERRLKPTLRRFLLSQTPRTVGRGRTGWGGRTHVSLTLTAAGAPAGRHCLLRRCQSARPGWLPALPPARSPPTSPLARPLVHTRAPRSSSQVARPCHLPPCQNRSAPAPDPDHSRHPASSLKFWNSAGRNSGRLDRSRARTRSNWKEVKRTRGTPECEGQCVCGGERHHTQALFISDSSPPKGQSHSASV